jgi:hypothetical protein
MRVQNEILNLHQGYHLNSVNSMEIAHKLVEQWALAAFSYSQSQYWKSEFAMGQEEINDGMTSGRPLISFVRREIRVRSLHNYVSVEILLREHPLFRQLSSLSISFFNAHALSGLRIFS